MKLSPLIYKIVHPANLINKRINKRLKKYINPYTKFTLDFGCGVGLNSSIFNSKQYLGVDIDKDRIKYAKTLYPNYNFSAIKNNKIEIPDESVDLIFICGVIHHLSNEEVMAYFHEFQRILKKDGQIARFEPCISKRYKIRSYLMKLFDEGKYIRNIKDYTKLFDKKFKVNIHTIFKSIYFYRMLFFSAKKN